MFTLVRLFLGGGVFFCVDAIGESLSPVPNTDPQPKDFSPLGLGRPLSQHRFFHLSSLLDLDGRKTGPIFFLFEQEGRYHPLLVHYLAHLAYFFFPPRVTKVPYLFFPPSPLAKRYDFVFTCFRLGEKALFWPGFRGLVLPTRTCLFSSS